MGLERVGSQELTEAAPQTGPAEGTEILIPVLQSPTRTTLFPDQTIIATASPEFVEVVFMRNEIHLAAQRGVVRKSERDTIDVEIKDAQIGAQLTDVGHVRMPVAAAVDMALNILRHAGANHGVDLAEAISSLTNSSVETK
jgi:hypothetical protein